MNLRQRIYAFPNAYGFVGFGLFIVILLAGATYQNNLVFMMAFLVLSLGLIAILQTARNLRSLELISLHIEPSFAGTSTIAWLTLKNNSDSIKLNIQATLETKKNKKWAIAEFNEIAGKSTATIKVKILLPDQRGLHSLRRMRLSTSYPYSLFYIWTFLKITQKYLAYPKPLGQMTLPGTLQKNGEDFSGHKNFTASDSFKRIDWKIFSRRQELFIKEFNDGIQKKIKIEYPQGSNLDTEALLSQLTLWTDFAEKNGYEYQLVLPQQSTALGNGPLHLHACLERLALYQ